MPLRPEPAPLPRDPIEAFADRVREARDRLSPRLPEVDPGDLLLILQSLLRPPGWERRYFLRSVRPGVYVP
ncbi:MAG TPA: hypothetical protein VFI25_07645 [Planctomycetota bacterium]|nr:hypothetical protein [Planctomycetota bacterium]